MATKDKDPAVPPPAEVKRHAFGQVADALEPLDRYDRLDVLRAVANFYGLAVVMETPR